MAAQPELIAQSPASDDTVLNIYGVAQSTHSRKTSKSYKILAQQEEGITNVKCKRSARGRTAGIVTIVLLLVCGVITTAVLVPLVLTNDFITLTGTFQKFSVSTLRRSHSGNHVVVIAKKPHGWNASHQSVLQSPDKSTNASLNHVSTKAKETTTTSEPTTVNNTLSALTTTPKTSNLENNIRKTSPREEGTELGGTKTKFTVPTTSAGNRAQNLNVRGEHDLLKLSPTITTFLQQKDVQSEVVLNMQGITSTSVEPPSWYKHPKWSFESPGSFINWSKNRIWNNPLSTAVAGFSVVAFIIILIFILMKSLPSRRKLVQKESADSKEDKTRLLKPSARTSDEE